MGVERMKESDGLSMSPILKNLELEWGGRKKDKIYHVPRVSSSIRYDVKKNSRVKASTNT